MELQGVAPLRLLMKEAHSTARKAQSLRNRLEEHLSAPPLELANETSSLRGGQAAVLAEAILGSAASQKMVELVRWVERELEFIHTLWPLAAAPASGGSAHAPREGAYRAPGSWAPAPLEYESTTAEDEDGTEPGGEEAQWREEEELMRVGVNLYLHIEDDLAAAAEGLVSMPKIANAIATGLIACRGVNMGFCAVVAAHRQTARRLVWVGQAADGVPPAMLRALEEAVVEVCDAVRSVLRAVQRGVALMQMAMDGVEVFAQRRTGSGDAER